MNKKEKWDKLITHDLVNLYNECESPTNSVWKAKVKKIIESFIRDLEENK